MYTLFQGQPGVAISARGGQGRRRGKAMLLGCIADDFTGATDLANTLTRRGMPCVQYNGLPGPGEPAEALPGAVVALKTRSIPAEEAVAQSLAALEWLRAKGCRKLFFKYCSTFDSTERGNIGPVAEALMDALGADITVACPAGPENGRTVYRGHLFVSDKLLSDTGMRHHPLTPMTDSNLVAVLGRQSRGSVGLVPYEAVEAGPEAIRGALEGLRAAGQRLAIVDALTEGHLAAIGAATEALPLITGGSGLALGLPAVFRAQGALSAEPEEAPAAPEGAAAVLSGSCSEATNRQVAAMRERGPSYRIDPAALAEDGNAVAAALDWARERLDGAPILLYATAPPERVAEVQAALGREKAGALVERAMGELARGLRQAGVRRLVVAGGETAGAVVGALGVRRLAIGPEIDPGVPWTFSRPAPNGEGSEGAEDQAPMALALKSGNFGGPDFFAKAFEVLS